VLEWCSDTIFAVRAYGATAMPSRGEFFTLGSDTLFRGFDMAQRQGSSVWVGSVEMRVPVAQRLSVDAVDHVVGLRNVYVAGFYDVGNAYIRGHEVAPIAHALGGGLRLDVSWFSFVERTTLRLDVAKALNTSTGLQVWLGINQPF
jgi:hemolysin activation/secretion protein